jgi:hypothetical protein
MDRLLESTKTLMSLHFREFKDVPAVAACAILSRPPVAKEF